MSSYLFSQILYTKAVFLALTATLVLVWAGYFCLALVKRHGSLSLKQYSYYISYTVGLFIWILSNSYFHTGLLKEYGNAIAINMAIVANISALVAFASAYLFSAKLQNYYAHKSVASWQSLLVTIIVAFGVICNLVPELTVKGVTIMGPSQFELEFGPYTQPFFLGLTTLVILTFINLLSLKNSSNRIRRTRINYMILGMTIFMCSTAIIQLGFTFFFNDFSLTWLPPALSVSEMLFMGYALLTSRFYSPRYVFFILTSITTTALIYTGLLSVLNVFDNVRWTEVILMVLFVGLTWRKAYQSTQAIISQILYGEPISPVEKISRLEEEFQNSPSLAIDMLANYLGVPKENLRLLDDYQGANFYRPYFESSTTPLVIDEVEEELSQTSDQTLSTIHHNMSETQSAIVLPIYEGRNKLSHVLVSSYKSDGLHFSNEELSALERVLQKVQVHINYERKVRQSQALANSIAHEMRNPLTQVQFEFENLGQKIESRQSYSDLAIHVDKGKQAINRGRQLIDIILREVNSSSLDQEPAVPTSISSAIHSAVNQYGFDDEVMRQRVQLDISQDFVVKLNETLFNFVLFNLLRNAMYYFDSYPNSTICIRTEVGEYENRVIFSDTGPGIPQDYLTRIFDDFFSHNKSGGSGLGLGYCQRVMKAFGGSIRCESQEGEFTEFHLSFPTVAGATSVKVDNEKPKNIKPSIQEQATTFVANLKQSIERSDRHLILVVDDKEVQRSLVKLYLEQLGYDVVLANNGKVAIEIIHSNPIDLVFMDIQMPVMNGFEAANIIKCAYPTIPIIALSGESGERDLSMISELMDGRLSKPTTKQALAQMLTSALPMNVH